MTKITQQVRGGMRGTKEQNPECGRGQGDRKARGQEAGLQRSTKRARRKKQRRKDKG